MKTRNVRNALGAALSLSLLAFGCSPNAVDEKPMEFSSQSQALAHTPSGPGWGNLSYSSGEEFTRISMVDGSVGVPNEFPGLNLGYMFNGYFVGIFSDDHGWHGGGWLVLDVSDPRNPSQVARVYESGNCNSHCDDRSLLTGDFRENHGTGFSIINGRWYAAIPAGHGIEIWDFTDVAPGVGPTRTSKLDIPGITGGDYGNTAWQLTWQAPYVYVTHGSEGISTIDASDPANPFVVSNTPNSQTGGFRVGPIFAFGNLMVVSDMNNNSQVATLDISNPSQPALIDTYAGGETFYAICFNGEEIIFTERGGGADMQIASASDPTNITTRTNNTVTNPESLYCATQGDHVVMGNQEEIAKFDMSDPANPFLVGTGSMGTGSGSDHGQVTFFGNTIYVGDDHGNGNGFIVHQAAADTAAPRVSVVNPKNGATGQSTKSRIGLAMTDNILIESMDTTTFIVREQGTSTALSGFYSGQGDMINFTPSNELKPGTTYEVVVPASGLSDWSGNLTDQQFTSTFTTAGGGSTSGDGTGLEGKYYNGMNFETLAMTRTDATINFNWGTGTPDASVNTDGFSVRWQGEVKADFSETYTFYGTSDDGQRLWVNGTQLIDNWVDQGPTENSGTIALTAGSTYDITYEYYENGGGAEAYLRWSSPSLGKEIIPMGNLFPPGTSCTADCSGKVCGDDGCGGSCGTCASGESCDSAGQCVTSGGGPPGDGWTHCADENGFCSFGGTKEVAYGADSSWNYGDFTDGVNCDNATFGDPISGASKSCFYRQLGGEVLLTGTQFGCCGEYTTGSGFQNALDDDTNTYFDAGQSDGNYAGLDLGTAQPITKARFWPRGDQLARMVGGKFQGSNTSETSGYVDLHTISTEPTADQWTDVTLSGDSYRWVRYLSPNGGWGNVSEVDFYSGGSATPITASLGSGGPATVGSSVSFTATASGGSGSLQYSFDFKDGSAPTAFSTSNTASHTFNSTGHYPVVVTVKDAEGVTQTANILQTIHNPVTANRPTKSSSIALSGSSVYAVNTDNDTLTQLDAGTLGKNWEVAVGDNPTTVDVDASGNAWVVNQGDSSISVISAAGGSVATYWMPRGSRPFGIAFDPSGSNAYVTLEATGRLLKLDPATGNTTGDIDVGADPRGIAVSADGSNVYVTRFLSAKTVAEVRQVDAGTFSVSNTITLQNDTTTVDAQDRSGGLPNYLVNIGINPDGQRAWIPSQKTNTDRGQFLSGENLEFDNAARTILSQIDLGTATEDFGAQFDIDDSNLAMDVAFTPLGDYVFVALEANNRVEMIDLYGGGEVLTLSTDLAPKGLVTNDAGTRLYVHNFMSRSVQMFDMSSVTDGSNLVANHMEKTTTVASESLASDVLLGKQIFYNSADPRMALDGYMSCASCHLDGNSDKRVWDFTDRGEGLRNTRSLIGAAGTRDGNVHWTANFDEIQDFENDIRNGFGGLGLLSDTDFNATSDPLGSPKAGLSSDLDALAAYVTSLADTPPSPYRNQDGSMTAAAQAGEQVFINKNCASCHSGEYFTDGQRHDVGTIQSSSGQGISAPLSGVGFDTPSLLGLWFKAPYLHNGQADTLSAVLNSASHGGTDTLTAQERSDLEQYLLQLEFSESAPSGGSGDGDGLEGSYYNGMGFETYVLTRTDTTVDFNWGTGSPATGVNSDSFSVRWEGFVSPDFSETYTFYGTSDDGQRLWVNGQLLVDNWVDQGPTENSGTITLEAGVQYEITYEYYENSGGAEAYLSWSSPSVAKQIIPTGNLFTSSTSGSVTIPALIEAEDYVLANESTPGSNEGGACDRGDGVDMQLTSDTQGGNCNVGWFDSGEWLEYDVDAGDGGTFDISARVASGTTGGSFSVLVDGVDVSGTVSVANNGWQAFSDYVVSGVSMSSGTHTVRVVSNGGINFNWLDLTSAATGEITIRAWLMSGTSDTLTLRLDDVDVQTWTIGSTAADYTYSGISGVKNVKVFFPDNATDAKTDYIIINGTTTMQAEDQATNTAAYLNGSCGGGGFSEEMHCQGYIDFGSVDFSN